MDFMYAGDVASEPEDDGMEWEDVDDGGGALQGAAAGQLASPGSGGVDNLDADGNVLPAWKIRMRQRHRFWSTSHGFKARHAADERHKLGCYC